MIVYNNKGAFGGRVPAPCRKGGAGARVGGTGFCGSSCSTFSQAKPFPRLSQPSGRSRSTCRAFGWAELDPSQRDPKTSFDYGLWAWGNNTWPDKN